VKYSLCKEEEEEEEQQQQQQQGEAWVRACLDVVLEMSHQ